MLLIYLLPIVAFASYSSGSSVHGSVSSLGTHLSTLASSLRGLGADVGSFRSTIGKLILMAKCAVSRGNGCALSLDSNARLIICNKRPTKSVPALNVGRTKG